MNAIAQMLLKSAFADVELVTAIAREAADVQLSLALRAGLLPGAEARDRGGRRSFLGDPLRGLDKFHPGRVRLLLGALGMDPFAGIRRSAAHRTEAPGLRGCKDQRIRLFVHTRLDSIHDHSRRESRRRAEFQKKG